MRPGAHGEHVAELVRIRRIVRAVEALHFRRPFDPFKDMVTHGQTEFPDVCDHCWGTAWPCETAVALSGEMSEEE